MSGASHLPRSRSGFETERHQRLIAALASLLVHVLFVVALLYSERLEVAPPEGSSDGGARVQVDFIGEPPQAEPNPPSPPTGAKVPADRPRPRKPVVTTPVTSPVDATRVTEAAEPVAPEQAAPEAAPRQGQPLPPRPSGGQPYRRSAAQWGQPPGMLPRETAPENLGRTARVGRSQGRGAGDTGPSVDVDGHQIYYDLRNELRVREWQARGMTEIYFPLPRRVELMVCDLEIVARRDSGKCRLMQPDDPALAGIGDARDIVIVQRVYRRGELIWSGPGVYR